MALQAGRYRVLAPALIGALLATACGMLPFAATPTVAPAVLPTSVPVETPAPATSLTICIGEEPNTLFPFGDLNNGARTVLQAIDDGPIDNASYEHQGVLIKQVPSLKNGDAVLSPVNVQLGDKVVDATGNVTVLKEDTLVRPAGCTDDTCLATFATMGETQMDQLQVTYQLRGDINWSDGTPLNAQDSVYGFELASAARPVAMRALIDRTQSYTSTDDTTTVWTGLPGYLDASYMTNFWLPAPEHAWGNTDAAKVGTLPEASQKPMGWGAYMIQDWSAGKSLTLARNPFYFGAANGMPKFDRLEFRFITDANAAIAQLAGGSCDIIDPTVRLDGQTALLQQMQYAGTAQLLTSYGTSIEWLGINTASRGPHNNYLADARTRQALALCIDRKSIVENAALGQSRLPITFARPDDPLLNGTVASYEFDQVAGNKALTASGWIDLDRNPQTPRTASKIPGVLNGKPLTLDLYATPTEGRIGTADIIVKSLAGCGVAVTTHFIPQNELYGPGGASPLFGRHFDLALYSMASDSLQPPCGWFTTDEIPAEANGWVGTNPTGYSNAEYDAACHTAQVTLPGQDGYSSAYLDPQSLFAEGVPAIPLFYRTTVAAAAPDICHFTLDPTAPALWNIEAFNGGADCP